MLGPDFHNAGRLRLLLQKPGLKTQSAGAVWPESKPCAAAGISGVFTRLISEAGDQHPLFLKGDTPIAFIAGSGVINQCSGQRAGPDALNDPAGAGCG